jgi:hypothetical protein
MSDLRTALRNFFDEAATPLTAEEILARHETSYVRPQVRPDRRPLRALTLAMLITLAVVGGSLLGADLFGSDDRRAAPGSMADDYRYSGIEWLGFEFDYPGEGTTLDLIDAVTLIEGPGPYAESTLLELAGIDDRGYVGVLWISYQSGHGSIVRDAVVVEHPQIRPNIRLGCTARTVGTPSGHPAAVLQTPDGSSVLRAWHVELADMTIAEIDPALVVCGH